MKDSVGLKLLSKKMRMVNDMIKYKGGFKYDVYAVVSSIHVDNYERSITFICEKGKEINSIKLSIDQCIDLGIININPLFKFIK
jgi:methylaspartate ammonia-lyase